MPIYDKLLHLNVNEHTEDKPSGNGKSLTYLSWVWAIRELMEIAPDMTYEIVKQPNGLPYVCDPDVGYMVTTRMTIDGQTKEMWLPVMDGRNYAMKSQPYEVKTKYGVNTVQAATMMDINKAIMRCLVKNAAMFGLGLYIYAGEDLPDDILDDKPEVETVKVTPAVIPQTKAASVTMQRVDPVRLQKWNAVQNELKLQPAEMKAIYEQLKREKKVRDCSSNDLSDAEYETLLNDIRHFVSC